MIKRIFEIGARKPAGGHRVHPVPGTDAVIQILGFEKNKRTFYIRYRVLQIFKINYRVFLGDIRYRRRLYLTRKNRI